MSTHLSLAELRRLEAQMGDHHLIRCALLELISYRERDGKTPDNLRLLREHVDDLAERHRMLIQAARDVLAAVSYTGTRLVGREYDAFQKLCAVLAQESDE